MSGSGAETSRRSTTSAHKVLAVEEAIEAVGAGLRYLPLYSPDLTRRISSFIPTIHTDEYTNVWSPFGMQAYALF